MRACHILVFSLLLATTLTCNFNQYLSAASNQCEACPSLCVTCSNNISCTTCPSGFYLNVGVCLSCPASCITCFSINNCTRCANSYFLAADNFSCSACSNACLQCDSQSTCSKCSPNYFLSDSLCVTCNLNCTCDGNTQICTTTNNFSLTGLIIAAILGPIITLITIILSFKYCRKYCEKENYVQRERQQNQQQQQQQVVCNTEQQILENQHFKILGVLRNKQKRQWKNSNSNQTINKRQSCSICLLEEVDTKTSCNHHFHLKCLIIWLQKKLDCPICKRQNPRLKKYCIKCCLNYIQCKISLRNYTVQFYDTCVSCKDQLKRYDLSSQLEMNFFK